MLVIVSAAAHVCGGSTRFRLVPPSARGLVGSLSAALLLLTLLTFAGVASTLAGAATSAQAQIAWIPCANSNDFACGHLTVPLDPGGTVPGTVTLALRRHRSPVGEARSAIIALAGGPGQSAIPFAEQFAELLGPIASTRDLIVFDQRGIGLSQPLACHAFERPNLYRTLGQAVGACASQLGPTRAFYTTAATVADIEAIRQAAGYEKLVLYGTSYGTKVAEEYAQRFPSHVEALVLDSVVPPNGPDPLNRSTFAAVPRILHQLCAGRLCAHITREPVADLAHVVARQRSGPLHGRFIDSSGHAHSVAISSNDLIAMLVAGDFSPLLRAEMVTAVSAAAHGDPAPLARLLIHAESAEAEHEDFDNPLYYATTCEEQSFPWNPAAGPPARIAQARAALRKLPASVFAPFTAANAFTFSDISGCAYWPSLSDALPAPSGPLPDISTLILSGADDLRTPTANAREVAAQIPDAHLLVVPDTGHSVLSAEPTPCAEEALQALFAGHPIKPCQQIPTPLALRPPPLPPRHLTEVPPSAGVGGTPGRTLHAVALTLADFARQAGEAEAAALAAGSAIAAPTLGSGGLRAGWAHYNGGVFTFHDYSYIPGVTLSGTLKLESADLQIGGSAAAHGTLRLGAHQELTGTLGGHRVRLPRSAPASASAVPASASSAPANASSAPASASAATAIVGQDADAQARLYLGPSGAADLPGSARRLLALLGRLLTA
jgi:pimeloyl-ACP methyl ester carboxylesterase